MIPCISQATTLSTPFEQDLLAFARSGWSAVELWLTKLESFLESHPIRRAHQILQDEGLRPLAAAAQGGLLLSRGQERQAHWDHFRRRLEWLRELDVPTLVVVADFVGRLQPSDYAAGAAALVEAGEAAGEFGITIALEFQKANSFCASLDTTLALLAQGGAAHVGVCLDLFHYYCGPSKFEDLGLLTPENLAWVQISDLSGIPREVATDSDRILPGEGDFQLGPILDHLDRLGYAGGLSLELFNPQLWEAPVSVVADAAFRSMQRTLGAMRSQRTTGGTP